MNTTKKRKRVRVLALITAVSLSFSTNFALETHAENTTQKQKEMEQNISNLNKDKEALGKELSKASASLTALVEEIKKTQQELGAAKARELGQYELMKKRIKYIYESGSGNFFTMIFESESMADLLNHADFVSSISEYDRDMLEKLKIIHEEISKKETTLLEQQKELEAQQKNMTANYNQLVSMISTASEELEAYKAELAAAEAAKKAAEEAARKAAEERQQESASTNESEGTSSENKEESPSKKPQEKPSEKPQEKPNKPAKPSKPSSSTELALFAAILECEAIPSDYDALLAVATIIMNRKESPKYPNTITGVIYQRGQFSPTWSGKLDKVLARGPKQLCYTVAQDALNGARHPAVRNCYSFWASYTGRDGIIIGDNVFF